MDNYLSRRQFLDFMGRTSAAVSIGLTGLAGKTALGFASRRPSAPSFAMSPSADDKVVLARGLSYSLLAKLGDPLNSKGDTFGNDNDFIAVVAQSGNEALLWVNHETPNHLTLFNGQARPRSRSEVLNEMKAVGGSVLHLKRNGGIWELVKNSPRNRRVTGATEIAFSGKTRVAGSFKAHGTLANCSGGVTPWNTILSCEENFEDYYGDGKGSKSRYGWETAFERPAEHYGWVVEINPLTGEARKLIAGGRFSHEGATVTQAKDGRAVFYSGDDAEDQCLFKFISDRKDSLETGTLYVADTLKGRWIPLAVDQNAELKKKYKEQLQVCIHAREAAHLVGGTALDRPEGIAVDPKTGAVIIALTNNRSRDNHYGSLLRIDELGGDAGALSFKSSTLVTGGESTGFACPDNVVFDRNGDLWFTSDISGSALGAPPYSAFKNNGLFLVPLSGPMAGKAFQMASAPKEAEFTGPCFSADGKTLFLSVQHPGERSQSLKNPTSRWPDPAGIPRSAVIALSGPALDASLRYT